MNLKELARKAASTLFLSMLCLVAFAQGHQVNGTVKDATGEPMIGVNVLVKGTTNGTITDFDGNFSLSDVKDSDILSVTYIGYITQEVKVGNQKNINVVLKEDTETLDEVVVIGYGTVKKRDLTGSVASVSNEALVANPVADVSQALQGKLAGVSVVSQDGRPGATVSIRVRGGGSISQSNDPLFIVDGFPVSSIADIPADQIVSIDVLKDASSTAIYGARGANGVILVTTKGADKDRVSVSYSGYYQSKWAAKTPESMSAQDYVKYTWGYGTALGMGDQMAQYFGLGSKYGNHYDEYANMDAHNWTDDMLRTASAQNHNVTINGGGEKTKISFSVNYLNDDGIKIKSGYERFSTNLKLKQELAKGLNFELDARYVSTNVEGKDEARSGRGSLLSSAYQYRTIDTPLGSGDDALFQMGSKNVETGANPVGLTNAITDLTNRQNIRANAALNWEIIKGLKARTEFAIGHGWSEGKYYDDGSASSADNFTRGYKYAKLTKGNTENWRSVTTVNYEVQGLGDDHNLSFLLGNEVIKNTGGSSEMTGAGYSMAESWDMDRVFAMFNMYEPGHSENSYSNKVNTPTTTVSFFGRANYSLKGRYLFTATLRSDGSSKFGPNHRWGYFPAGAFAWRISDEPFFQSLAKTVDNLKLRLSYGLAGADNIDASLWRETWKTGTTTYNGNVVSTYEPNGMKANPDLKWETTTSRNLGFDFGLWGSRLSGTLDLYWNTTSDLLMRQEIDSSTGYSYQFRNIGQTSNKGLELALNYHLIRTKDFNLNVSATYNFNKNNIDELDGGKDIYYNSGWGSSAQHPSYDYVLTEGKPVGVIRGFKSAGFYTVDDFDYVNGVYKLKSGIPDISTAATGTYRRPSDLKIAEGQIAFPGALKLQDIDKSGIVDLDDVVDLGEVQAKHTGGFSLSGNYKNIDFGANFTYQIGGKVYNVAAMSQFSGGKETGLGLNKYKELANSFKLYDVQNGDLVAVTEPTALKQLNANARYALPYYEDAPVLSDYVEDASYLRLNTLTVGYTLPKAWTTKAYMQKVRVYVTGGNLFCITGYSGLDPEVNSDPDKAKSYPTLGLDWGAYMRARTFTVGLNIEF
ncbi:SusC/RagA family TonB-linked outer membrane protein [Phocaeicola sp.]